MHRYAPLCPFLLHSAYFISAIPVAPKTIRKDESGTSGILRVKSTTQIPARTVVPIAPKPSVSEKSPDFSLLNKPPPIPFYLPKAAALAPRTVNSDPLNEPPEVALKKLEAEASTLKEEVAALKWLAKRKVEQF